MPLLRAVGALARVADGVDEVSGRRLGLFRGRDPRHRRRGARPPDLCAGPPTAEAISRAVRCGVRTIEHGNLVDAEAARLMAGQGAYVTLIYEALANEGADLGLPADSVAKVAQVRNACIRWRSTETPACRWAKIMASGGVASPPIRSAPGDSEDEIRAIVAEARARQTYVLARPTPPRRSRARCAACAPSSTATWSTPRRRG